MYLERWWGLRDSPVQSVLIRDSTLLPRPRLDDFFPWGGLFAKSEAEYNQNFNIKLKKSDVFAYFDSTVPEFEWGAILREFDSLNTRKYPVDSARVQMPVRSRVVHIDTMWKAGSIPGWARSGGLITFSRVALNPSMNQAFVYYHIADVEHGGTEAYAALSNRGQGWFIRKLIMACTI
jgi:hypothetical protein